MCHDIEILNLRNVRSAVAMFLFQLRALLFYSASHLRKNSSFPPSFYVLSVSWDKDLSPGWSENPSFAQTGLELAIVCLSLQSVGIIDCTWQGKEHLSRKHLSLCFIILNFSSIILFNLLGCTAFCTCGGQRVMLWGRFSSFTLTFFPRLLSSLLYTEFKKRNHDGTYSHPGTHVFLHALFLLIQLKSLSEMRSMN